MPISVCLVAIATCQPISMLSVHYVSSKHGLLVAM